MAVAGITDVSRRARAVESLQNLIQRTEKIYLRLGKTLPDTLKELERGFDDAMKLVGYFTAARGATAGAASAAESGVVGNVLQDARGVIADASGFFSHMEVSDQASFQSINGGIQNLSVLEEKLRAIREDSIEMELISLNAMTVALKAGQAGRAFSVITEELKLLSSETIGRTDILTEEGKKILELFRFFRGAIEGVQKFQEGFYAGFRGKLESSFENFSLGVAKMAEILLQVIEGAGNTRKPLHRVMEEIQRQDIIRQSTQHVVLSLSQDSEGSLLEGDSSDELLDELTFAAMLPELSTALLKEVESNVGRGATVFRESLAELRGMLESAEQEKQIFVEYFGSGENALEKMFEESIGGMSGLLESVGKSMTEKAKLSPEGTKILEGLKRLQESFEEFAAFVDRFRTVDIAARIELAKQDALRAKRDTMGSLTGLAGRIGGDVKAALEIILQTIERIETTIERFGKDVERESGLVSTLVEAIRGVYGRLTQAKDFLSHSMGEFSLYTKRFFGLIKELEGEAGELEGLVKVVGGIIEDLAELRSQLQERREAALRRRGLTEWAIHNNKLKDMIGKFTILGHKKTAAELGGFAVEEGGQPGELTLF